MISRKSAFTRLDVGKASKNAENAGKKGGFYGGILGIFLYWNVFIS